MAKVRACTLEDIDWMMETAKEFNDKYFYVPLDLEKSAIHLVNVVTHGVAIRSDDAVIIGMWHMDPMRDWSVLVELGWYSHKPGEGIAVLKEFVNQGHKAGVDEIRMTTLSTNTGAARILERLGFSPVETSHRLLI